MTRTSLWLAGSALCLLAPAAFAQDEGAAAPLLDLFRQNSPPGTVVSYDSVTAAGADATFGNFRILRDGSPVLAVGRLQLTGIGAPSIEGALPLIDTIDISDARLTPPADSEDSGAITVRHLAVSGVDFNTLIAAAMTGDPDSLLGALDITSLHIEDLQGDIQDGDDPDENQTFSLGSLALDGLQGGLLDSFTLSGFALERPSGDEAGRVAVASVDVGGLDLNPLIAIIAGGDEPELGDLAGLELDHVLIRGMDVDTPDNPTVTIDQIAITDVTRQAGKLIGHNFNLVMSMPVADVEDDEAREVFSQLGLTDLPIKMSYVQRLDPATRTLSIDPLTFSVAGVGGVTAALQVGNAPVEAYLQGGDINPGSLITVTLDSFRLTYRDEGLVPELLDRAATEQGMAPADLIAGGMAQIRGALSAGGDPAVVGPIADALEAFLRSPGQLTLTLSPAAPVAISNIMAAGMTAPGSLPQALNLSVEAH